MSEAVLDSSALLALLFAEPGADRVAAALPGAFLSTVNLAEVVAKLTERGMPAAEASEAVRALGATVVDFDHDQAVAAGALRGETRGAGLSLGDRACLALSRLRGATALTGDRAWAAVKGFDVSLIR